MAEALSSSNFQISGLSDLCNAIKKYWKKISFHRHFKTQGVLYIVFKIKYINENVAKRHSISNQKLRVRKGNTTFKYIFGLLTVLNAYSLEASHGTTNTAFNHNRR